LKVKQFRLSFLATTPIFVMGWLAAPAHADSFTVSGFTSGTFSPAQSKLSFTGATFGPTSSDTLTLGTFNLSNGTTSYNGVSFDLTVTFSAPPGTVGPDITGNLTGSVTGNSGSVTITFTNPTLFTFPGGSFDLSANAVTAMLGTNAGMATLTGTLSNETLVTPEPVSLVLLGTCVAAMGFVRRKRWI